MQFAFGGMSTSELSILDLNNGENETMGKK